MAIPKVGETITIEEFNKLPGTKKKLPEIGETITAEQFDRLGLQRKQPKKKGSVLGNITRSILKPPITLLSRPFQLGKALAGATPEEQAIDLPFFGRIESPTTGKDIVRDVGRAAETVALGVGGAGAANVGRQALGGAAKQATRQAVKKSVSPGLRTLATLRNQANRLGAISGASPFRTGLKTGAVAGGISGAGASAEREGRVGLGTIFESGLGALGGAALGGVIGGTAGGLSRLAQRSARGVKRPLPGVAGQLQKAGRKRVSKSLQEKVMPQLTAKEIRLAKAQGRIIRSRKSTIFGKKPDVVLPDKATSKAITTLQRRIKGVDKLDDIQIANSARREIGTIANRLKPSMQKVRLKANTMKSARQSWKRLKARQLAEPESDAFAGTAKFQQRFESFLKATNQNVRDVKTGKFRPRNLDDLWEIAKRYDDVIPDRVKQARSGEGLQFQREMWLQNRKIMRDILKDTSKGLGSKAKQSFSDMTDLYRIRNNIISKSDIGKKKTLGLGRPRNLAISAGILGIPTVASIIGRSRE